MIILEWLAVPGGLAVIIAIINSFFFTLQNSPLNSFYSIVVAIWATLFVIFWKRRTRGLFIEWDNHSAHY